jgi:hypothetical protein
MRVVSVASGFLAYPVVPPAEPSCISGDISRVLLRAQLHYELALCELSADFLVKASEQLTYSLAIDYGRVEKEVADVLAGS